MSIVGEVAIRQYQFIPDILVNHFVHDTLDAYFHTAEEYDDTFPNLYSLTYDVIDPIGLQAAGYHATAGEDIDFFNNQISSIENFEEQGKMFYSLVDKNFQSTFEDVVELVKGYRLSYCFLDEPKYIRKDLQHYAVEVW